MKKVSLMLCCIMFSVQAEITVPDGILNLHSWKGYQEYQARNDLENRAFAVSESGAWGWGKSDIEALRSCRKHGDVCKIINRAGKSLVKTHRTEGFMSRYSEPDGFPVSINTLKTLNSYKNEYLPKPGNKAFAVSKSGAWAFMTGYVSKDEVVKRVIARCQSHNKRKKDSPCRLVDVNNQVVTELLPWKNLITSFDDYPTYEQGHWPNNFLREDYQQYKRLEGVKALALSESGAWNWSHGFTNKRSAINRALKNCDRLHDTVKACKIIMINNELSGD